ncbi:Pectate lyase superfamily protein [Parapedobacter composti]|uniref:Pectate lyase superfamily protein n=1 Tax=Parapedobacter composti TaxID=623281 RepID=A0A1I1H2T7_9SPHI|nr:glycoside hydrolase family 28 protein [Parapedobacter composti]SFC15510.1 Pectate lyase superfamily protein [Parapedobacter composti]
MSVFRVGLLLWIGVGIGTARAQPYYNVLEYGAVNDSSALITEAVRLAIAKASDNGGGTIFFPAGKYLTGPIHLKSNITLYLDAGAELHFSDNFDHYLPMVPSRWEGTDVINFSPLIYAYGAENIAITGRGRLNGNGRTWWMYFFDHIYGKDTAGNVSRWQREFFSQNRNVVPPDEPGWIAKGFLRPPFIQFMHCRDVLVEGITITNSPFWTLNPQYCENVKIDAVTINNPPSPNTDGINPESCRNVHIANCHISVGDDCITIKSGKDRSGRLAAAPAENYVITNCTMLRGHGGVVIGSEMSGGVRNISISNCVFDGTHRGLRIKTARGRGGIVEDIRMSNIVMRNIREEVIVLNMQYAETAPEPVSERTPVFRNIRFSNMTAEGNRAVLIHGLEEMPVQDVSFYDVDIRAKEGILVRHANQLDFHGIRIQTEAGSALQAQWVTGLEIGGLAVRRPPAGTPLVKLADTRNVFIHTSTAASGTDVFLEVSGIRSANVVLKNNVLDLAVQQVVQRDGVDCVTLKP